MNPFAGASQMSETSYDALTLVYNQKNGMALDLYLPSGIEQEHLPLISKTCHPVLRKLRNHSVYFHGGDCSVQQPHRSADKVQVD